MTRPSQQSTIIKKREAANASAIASANTANERLSQTIDRLAANAETDASYRAQYAATTGSATQRV